jgi:hypothetical protein
MALKHPRLLFLLFAALPERGPCPLSKRPVIPAHDLVVVRLPFAGLLGSSWPIKFEGQFKYRDERGVNARAAQPITKSQKCFSRSDKSQIVKFGLPCRLAQR